MRIAILVAGFPPRSIGGAEVATLNIATELVQRGHEVHVITIGDKELKGDNKGDFYIHYIQLGAAPEASLWGAISYAVKAFAQIRRINPDIVHAQRFYREGLAAFLAKVLLKKRYCIWCRGADVYLSWRFKGIASELFLKRANAVIALTQNMKEKIYEICNRDAFVIPNGIDLRRFESLSHQDTHTLAVNGEIAILFVGRLHPIKGVAYLIEAMPVIIRKHPKVKLFLVGDGEERQRLESLVAKLDLDKHTTFIGQIPNEKVSQYMAASDVFVLPSLSEGLPVVTLEAIACGLPIVVTDIAGISEIIKDGENGFLVEPENSVEIAEKVLMLLGNGELRKQISQNNLEKSKNYSWEAVVDKLEDVYQGVLK